MHLVQIELFRVIIMIDALRANTLIMLSITIIMADKRPVDVLQTVVSRNRVELRGHELLYASYTLVFIIP